MVYQHQNQEFSENSLRFKEEKNNVSKCEYEKVSMKEGMNRKKGMCNTVDCY